MQHAYISTVTIYPAGDGNKQRFNIRVEMPDGTTKVVRVEREGNSDVSDTILSRVYEECEAKNVQFDPDSQQANLRMFLTQAGVRFVELPAPTNPPPALSVPLDSR